MEERERNETEQPVNVDDELTKTGDDSQNPEQGSGSANPRDAVSELAGEVTTGDEP